MTSPIPPDTTETIHRFTGALGNLPDAGSKLPMIVAVDEPAGWMAPWVLCSRTAASIGISLAGHVGVLAWLGFASSVFLHQRVPVQQGQASIQLQATFASAAAAQHVETDVELMDPEQVQPVWDREAVQPTWPEAASPTPVIVQRVDVKLPLPDEDTPQVDSPNPTAKTQQTMEREDDSPAGPRQEPPTNSQIARSAIAVEPIIEVFAESAEPISSAASASSAASKASEGANSVPAIVFNPAPQYPAAALRARQTGRVTVHVTILPEGTVAEARVHKTSGFPALDHAAVEAVRVWRFAAVDGFASSVRQAAIPIRFVID